MSTRKYRKNRGLRKFCSCPRRTWNDPTCPHNWHFNFRDERGSLGTSDRNEADARLATIVAQIKNGTYVRPTKAAPAVAAPTAERPTFATVADLYAKDAEGLAKLSGSSKRHHHVEMKFLTMVVVPPGIRFTDKVFTEIMRADAKQVELAKTTPTERLYTSTRGATWTRAVGGKVAWNRLRAHLRSLWNWAIAEGLATTSPFVQVRAGKDRLKYDEFARSRRLRDGEESALLASANPHLRDVIVVALATAMRIGEILSLQWKQVLWLQNELYLPAGKTKSKRDRIVPIGIKPELREILTRRQHGTIQGPDGPRPFTFGPDHYVFGDDAGRQIKSISTAWENTVLRAHSATPEQTRRGGSLTAACRARLAEIDLNVHDLRRECASRLYFNEGWTLYDVSLLLGHADVKTTERYIGADRKSRLHELVARRPLMLVKG
jgi:integrase